MNVGLYRNLTYDPVADFAPVSGVATSPRLLVPHRLDVATREALPQIIARFTGLGLEPLSSGPQEMSAYLRAEIAK
jgi:tripartite-type tricarboxylate transporter receptor subunit TctC